VDLQQLLDRARAGDRTAWNRLLEHLRPWVRALLRASLVRDGDASDLTQEVQLRMARGFERFRGESVTQLRAWTRSIAANVVYDHHGPVRPPLRPLPESLCASEPSRPVVDDEDMTHLLGALEWLPEHYRRVIEGRLFDHLSCEEIARRMGRLPATVRTWCLRAVRELHERLIPSCNDLVPFTG
jgi:RNA polymerase sigma-70 factor (ECF subfamily)